MWEIFIPKGLETGHGECKRGTTLKNFLDKLIRKKNLEIPPLIQNFFGASGCRLVLEATHAARHSEEGCR